MGTPPFSNWEPLPQTSTQVLILNPSASHPASNHASASWKSSLIEVNKTRSLGRQTFNPPRLDSMQTKILLQLYKY